MKCIIVDFVSISFTRFKVHGGGDFALRAIEYLISNGKKFFIVNNTTDFFQDYSANNIEDIRQEIENFTEINYFNPLYQGGDENTFLYNKKYFYIHGLRMLEMPYDSTSHRYFKFPEN